MGEEASLLEPLLPMVIAFLHKRATSPVVQQEVVTEPMEADNVSAIPRCATECCHSLHRRSRACPQTPLPLSPLPTAQLRSLGSRAGDNATERRLATQRRRPGGSRAKAALPRPTKSRPPSRLAGHSKSVEFGSAPRHSRSSCSRVVSGGARSRSWRASLAVEKFKPSSRRTTDAVSRAGTDSKHAGYLYLG